MEYIKLICLGLQFYFVLRDLFYRLFILIAFIFLSEEHKKEAIKSALKKNENNILKISFSEKINYLSRILLLILVLLHNL